MAFFSGLKEGSFSVEKLPSFAVTCLLLLPPNGRMEKGKDGEDFETAG